MRVYHQYAVLYIISAKGAAYHQTEAFYARLREMIYKAQALDDIQRLAAFDDMPNLATLRFGYKKMSEQSDIFVLVTPTGVPRLCGPTR